MGGAILTLNERVISGESASLRLVDGMNDTSERVGLGVAVCCDECNISKIISR